MTVRKKIRQRRVIDLLNKQINDLRILLKGATELSDYMKYIRNKHVIENTKELNTKKVERLIVNKEIELTTLKSRV